jgi:2-polyprenyl-3-methyl-5-hydroxy-6-metoxy-1,4-benzoquinol methylase
LTQYSPYLVKPSRWSSHSRIVARLNVLPAHNKVLDVGTATGILARMCQNKPLRFFGVESNATWAQIAAPFYEKIWVQSIEDMDEEFLKGYNAIILADVLEHLSEPEDVLQKLVNLQPAESVFIISVPNIANLWVRLNLFFGYFDYTERGILDRAHLRFFTRKTLLAMVKNVGLEIVSIQVTPIPLELISIIFTNAPGKAFHAALAWLTYLLPTLLGYQFILEAKKHEH